MKNRNDKASKPYPKTFKLTPVPLANPQARDRQHGVVLFFALIALVVMSLAAVALIRSVDTNSMIAGNLSFKQSTMLSADRGVETAMSWIAANPGSLAANSAANGYYATSNADARALVDANGKFDVLDSFGNSISYVVQRMCRATGFPPADAENFCLYGQLIDPPKPTESLWPPPLIVKNPSLVYRITAKVVGPRHTVSYIQTYAY
jgi:type IV pilus assembly protein PilX